MSTTPPEQTGLPRHYAGSQVALHWVIAVLILCQYLFSEEIEQAWRAWRRGGDAAAAETPLGANLHVIFGLTILALAIVRVAIRLRRGAPPVPKNHPAIMRFAAYGTHFALYAFLFLMPISGAAAWFGGIGLAAYTHVIAKNFLLAFLALHVLGALFELLYAFTPSTRQMLTFGAVR